MYIDELTPEQSVTLIANVNGEELSFDTKIQEVNSKKKLVLAEPVFRDAKVITFRNTNIALDLLVNMGDEQPYIFKNITITLMKRADGSLCYNITAPTEGRSYNRRQNFRCFIGSEVNMQYGANHLTCPAILRDVSHTGFAVVCMEQVVLEEGQVIHVHLKDHIEATDEYFQFHLYGIVVRKQDMQKGRVLYGCRLNNRVIGLDNYIMKKERLRIRKN